MFVCLPDRPLWPELSITIGVFRARAEAWNVYKMLMRQNPNPSFGLAQSKNLLLLYPDFLSAFSFTLWFFIRGDLTILLCFCSCDFPLPNSFCFLKWLNLPFRQGNMLLFESVLVRFCINFLCSSVFPFSTSTPTLLYVLLWLNSTLNAWDQGLYSYSQTLDFTGNRTTLCWPIWWRAGLCLCFNDLIPSSLSDAGAAPYSYFSRFFIFLIITTYMLATLTMSRTLFVL